MGNSNIDKHHNEYNDEPVTYCVDCLSLKIMTEDGIDYCDKCGSTNLKEANVFDWEKLYAAKYAGKYVDLK